MRKFVLIALVIAMAAPAFAELQNVEIGGEIRIRGRYWNRFFASGNRRVQYVPGASMPGRAMGMIRGDGGIWSRYDFDARGHERKYVEQRTVVNVAAEFTDDVCAFIEFESYDVWGEDFRSDYITGGDFITPTNDDVEVIQAYIEAKDMWGTPLDLRVGRQLIKLGKGWLVHPMFSGTRALPFDAIRFTYDVDNFEVDAIWSKLQDNSPAEEDGDIDFYAIYGTYKASEALNVSLYWMYLRDAVAQDDTQLGLIGEAIEDWFSVDQYSVTKLHTFGARVFGETGGFDYDLEVAFQTGDAHSTGILFRPVNSIYGDDTAKYDQWGMDLEVGYSFDMQMSPRVYVGGFYLGGEDNRDVSFFDYIASLVNPFYQGQASVSFNRLFSGVSYSKMMDGEQIWSNVWQVRGGVSFKPTEKLKANVELAYWSIVDPFDRPVVLGDTAGGLFNTGILCPLLPLFPWWTEESDSDLGYSLLGTLRYQYTKDVYFEVGWEHLFTGDGMTQGNFGPYYGLWNTMGTDTEDADYWYIDTRIRF